MIKLEHQINITQAMLNEAREYHNKVNKTKTVQLTSNYLKNMRDDRYFVGYLGELIVREFFKNKKKEFVHYNEADGRADKGDFLLWEYLPKKDSDILEKYQWTIDVKTGFTNKLMLNCKQIEKTGHKDLYFYVKLDPQYKFGEVKGYVTRIEFDKSNNYEPSKLGGQNKVFIFN